MWKKARLLSYFIEFCVVQDTIEQPLKPQPELVESSFGARWGGVCRSPEGRGRSGGVQS